MHKISRMFCTLALSTVVLSGCNHTAEESGIGQITGPVRETMEESGKEPITDLAEETMKAPAEAGLPEEVISGMTLIMAGNLSEEGLTMERRLLMDQSSEGGEIVRYQDGRGEAVRYQLIFYGEMGRWEENYYFRNKGIYHTELVENYSAPIYDPEMEVKDCEIRQGVLYNGVYCQYDSRSNTFTPMDISEMPYRSLEELQEVFEHAEMEFGGRKDTEGIDFSEYQILAIDGFILGGYKNQAWIGCDDLYPMMEEKNEYKIYIDGHYHLTATGYKEWMELEDERLMHWGPMVDFPDIPFSNGRDYNTIAFSGRHDLKIESGMEISPENKIYQEILKDYLEDTGFTEAFKLTKILKIDLEDDGQDEIFIQAYHFADPNHLSAGIQFMRKITGDGIKVYPIPITDPTSEADCITIIGFCDLDRDGVKEVLMSSSGVAYSSYLVYESKDGQFTRIYENGVDH